MAERADAPLPITTPAHFIEGGYDAS
jgi:hypothetical protein